MLSVILCGGSGSRLWPLSREGMPKQFINFLEDRTLLQRTALGNRKYCSDFLLVCNSEHSNLALQQLAECSLIPLKCILEPAPRNTAAAVCLAMLSLDPEEIALITPADHHIDYSEGYLKAIQQAEEFAKQDQITIFGVVPNRPETGYGYIEAPLGHIVTRFHEKPNEDVARTYIEKGHFFWNTGMICAKAGVLLQAMRQYAPEILLKTEEAYKKITKTKSNATLYKVPFEEMAKIPSESIDYALLEKMNNLKFVRGNFLWCDVGSFDSLFIQMPKDAEGNAVSAKNFMSVDSKNNLVIGNNRMISTIDTENLVIVDTPDALLISKIGSTQKVKDVVNKLKGTNTTLHKAHIEEHRPWGSFTVLESQKTCKVKKLVVLPGKRLSLQKHQHRAEHWVVVAGDPLITIGNEQRLLHPNQSIFIPQGELHRIENQGTENVMIIEVQYGEYTGEDDIVRIEDDFHRVPELVET